MVRKGLKVFLTARRISIAFFLQLTQMTRRVADLNSRVKTAQANITLIQVQKMIVGPSLFVWRSRQSCFKPIVYLSLIHDTWAKPLYRCLSRRFEGGYVGMRCVVVVVMVMVGHMVVMVMVMMVMVQR